MYLSTKECSSLDLHSVGVGSSFVAWKLIVSGSFLLSSFGDREFYQVVVTATLVVVTLDQCHCQPLRLWVRTPSSSFTHCRTRIVFPTASLAVPHLPPDFRLKEGRPKAELGVWSYSLPAVEVWTEIPRHKTHLFSGTCRWGGCRCELVFAPALHNN